MPPKPGGGPQKDARGGITTTVEVDCWRQRLKSEAKTTEKVLAQGRRSCGHGRAASLDHVRKNDILVNLSSSGVEHTPRSRPQTSRENSKIVPGHRTVLTNLPKILPRLLARTVLTDFPKIVPRLR